MPTEKDLTSVTSKLNSLLTSTKIDDVTSESSGFTALPDGYYLCQVESAQLTESKTSHEPMVKFQFVVTENGVNVNINDDSTTESIDIKNTKNRKIFVNYVLKDDRSVKRFVADMLKFEGSEQGVSLLDKEYFTNSELLEDALDILIGYNIYIQVSTTGEGDTASTWNNLISWKRAAMLDLLV